MKLFITTGIFPPDIGGPATYLENIINHSKFSKINKTILTLADQKKIMLIEKNDLYTIIKIKRNLNLILRIGLTLFYINRYAKDSDIIYSNGLFFETNLYCLFKNKKFIAKIVGDYHWERFKRYNYFKSTIENFNKSSSLIINLVKIIRRFTFKKCQKIIVPSNYLKKVVISWKLNTNNIQIIYNSINFEKNFDKYTYFNKKKYGLKNNDVVICTISRLAEHKNIPEMIKLIDYKKNFKHFIIGEGPKFKEIQNLINNLKLNKKIYLLGALNKNQVYSFLKVSDLFILYSSYEGFPHVVLEAMYFKNIVIASNVGGNKEIIKHKKNGFLVELGNKTQLNKAIKNSINFDKNIINKDQKLTLSKFNNKNLINQTYQHLIKN